MHALRGLGWDCVGFARGEWRIHNILRFAICNTLMAMMVWVARLAFLKMHGEAFALMMSGARGCGHRGGREGINGWAV